MLPRLTVRIKWTRAFSYSGYGGCLHPQGEIPERSPRGRLTAPALPGSRRRKIHPHCWAKAGVYAMPVASRARLTRRAGSAPERRRRPKVSAKDGANNARPRMGPGPGAPHHGWLLAKVTTTPRTAGDGSPAAHFAAFHKFARSSFCEKSGHGWPFWCITYAGHLPLRPRPSTQ